MRWANEHRVALAVPSGGRNPACPAARSRPTANWSACNACAGCWLDPVDTRWRSRPAFPAGGAGGGAREHGLQYPVGYASRGTATIGGSIATNAGGVRALRFGNTREWIAGLKLVTGSGELLGPNRGLLKNSSGYDLRHLAIGAEGTLEIVVEATLRLADRRPPTR